MFLVPYSYYKIFNKLLGNQADENVEEADFIKRIRSLVIGEGMLKKGNINLMNFALKNLPPKGHIIEIGSYGGLSTNVLIYLMCKHKKSRLFFTCDAWIYEGYNDHLKPTADNYIDGRKDVLRADYSVYIKNAFINSTRLLSAKNLPHSFHMYSDLFFSYWNDCKMKVDIFGRGIKLGGDISFAYIDGGHSYDVALSDFNNIASHLVSNGFILLDDSGDEQNFGSAKIMGVIKKDERFRIIAKNPNYLIQKIK